MNMNGDTSAFFDTKRDVGADDLICEFIAPSFAVSMHRLGFFVTTLERSKTKKTFFCDASCQVFVTRHTR